MRRAPHNPPSNRPDPYLKPGKESGTYLFDVNKLEKELFGGKPHAFAQCFADVSLPNGLLNLENKSLDAYLEEMHSGLAPLIQQKLRGFPLGVPILVRVEDAKGGQASLTHTILVDLSKKEVEEDWNAFVRGKLAMFSSNMASRELPPPRFPLLMPENFSRADLGDVIRDRIRPNPVATKGVAAAAMNIILQHEQSLLGALSQLQKMPIRTWKTTKGKSVKGTVTGIVGGQVMVALESKPPMSVPLNELEPESLNQLWNDFGSAIAPEPSTPEGGQPPMQSPVQQQPRNRPLSARQRREQGLRERARRQAGQPAVNPPPNFQRPTTGPVINRGSDSRRHPNPVGTALQAFGRTYGFLPPESLVDKKGRRLLSWRVLILPELGYSELYKLFRLDEPWDSPHNRQLLSFMPREYATMGVPLSPGMTGMLAVVGPNTAFPPDGVRSLFDLTDTSDGILLALLLGGRQPVEWTRPSDLEISQGADAFTMFGLGPNAEKAAPKPGRAIKDTVLGLFGDTTLEELTSDLSRELLLRAAVINDGNADGLRRTFRY
jgi:hypothetical protein